jgi:hypothetical protein
MSKLPAFQFYPGDWRKDPGVQSLSFHDRGVWFEMICIMHESECRGKLILNGMAMPQKALARLLGLDNQILTTTLTNLSTYGVTSFCEETGAIVSRRMLRDEEIRQVRKSCGKMGGNPNLVNQIPTTQVNQIPTPSSSSSSSSSISKEKKSKTPSAVSGKSPREEKFAPAAMTVYEFWKTKLKASARKQDALRWIQRRIEVHTAERLAMSIVRYSSECKSEEREARYIKDCANFFGEDATFEGFLPDAEYFEKNLEKAKAALSGVTV